MSALEFFVVSAEVEDENQVSVIFYGIRAVNDENSTVFDLPDISDSRESVEQFARLLCENAVEVKHLEDVIEDFFWS